MKKVLMSWVLCVLALVGLFAWLGGNPATNGTKNAGDTALIKASFTLETHPDKTVRATDFKGRYLLVYFGFTHCPDICPTTLLVMQNSLQKLGKRNSLVQPLFITIDPERDTPKAVSEYVAHFGKGFIGLSGSADAIHQAADSFKVYYSKAEDKNSALGYNMDHSSFIYLMGKQGEYLAHFPSSIAEQDLTEELKNYVR